ncbi:MAG: hypothetical protein AABY22_22430 [Nanoarchaeota archaeon]
MKNKSILWIRELSCGHERATNVGFIAEIYTKPNIGDTAYCRECMKEVKITKVRKGSEKEVKELKELIKSI